MKNKKVKIIWNDCKLFSPENKDVLISKMKTTGIFEAKRDSYVVIKNPITVDLKTKKKHPQKNPSYYLIPIEMIENIKEL